MVSANGTAVVFLKGLPTQSDVHEKVKIFEIFELGKRSGNRDDPFGLKSFFSCINIPDNFVA